MRFTELGFGDSIRIGDVTVTLEHKTGSRARFAISTDHDQTVIFIPKPDGKQQAEILCSPSVASTDKIG